MTVWIGDSGPGDATGLGMAAAIVRREEAVRRNGFIFGSWVVTFFLTLGMMVRAGFAGDPWGAPATFYIG